MIKKERPEDPILPEQATVLISHYIFTYDIINPSAYPDISGRLFTSLPLMGNFKSVENWRHERIIELILCRRGRINDVKDPS